MFNTVLGSHLSYKLVRIRGLTFILGCLFSAQSVCASSLTVYEHIALSQNISVSAHRLCHDGLYLHFKSLSECKKAQGPFVCERGLKIVPIRSVEKIYLDVGGPSLTRFYEISLNYKKRTLANSEESGEELIEESTETIPLCEGNEIFNSANVGEWRYIENEDEADFVQSFLEAGIDLINTPYGGLQFFKNINIPHQPIDPFKEKRARFKTPYCNQDLDQDSIKLMSGEYSGNGVMNFRVNVLQNLSRDIYIEKSKAIFDAQLNKNRTQYSFSCRPTRDV